MGRNIIPRLIYDRAVHVFDLQKYTRLRILLPWYMEYIMYIFS
jgi:hypothetical protein